MAGKFSPIVALALIFAAAVFFFYEPDNFDRESIRSKRVLVTGASSGIGAELAYQYCRLGAAVFVTARRGQLLEIVAEKCRRFGAELVEYAVADMTRPTDRRRLIDDVRRRFDGRLDHLVLNHAKYEGAVWRGTADDVSELVRDLDTNFVSHVDVASMALPMLRRCAGSIGVVSSVAGKIGLPLYASYSADKFALHGFFTAFRQELIAAAETEVSVTLCVLGYVDTERANNVSGHMFSAAAERLPGPMPVDETAAVIIEAIAERVYEVQYPWTTRLAVLAHKIAPGYVEDFFGNLVAKTNFVARQKPNT